MKSAPFLLLLFAACGNTNDAPPARLGTAQAAPHDERMLAENKLIAEREQRDIEDWIARQGVAMERTGTGVYIKLVRDAPGPNARAGQVATCDFTVSLLNGTECYRSGVDRPEAIAIEHADVESGLHEALQHLSVGDSAVIVIPSHRAFGLAGDQNRIPMRSTVVYRLTLLKLSE